MWKQQGVTLQMLIDKKSPQIIVSSEIQRYYFEILTLIENNKSVLFSNVKPS